MSRNIENILRLAAGWHETDRHIVVSMNRDALLRIPKGAGDVTQIRAVLQRRFSPPRLSRWQRIIAVFR